MLRWIPNAMSTIPKMMPAAPAAQKMTVSSRDGRHTALPAQAWFIEEPTRRTKLPATRKTTPTTAEAIPSDTHRRPALPRTAPRGPTGPDHSPPRA